MQTLSTLPSIQLRPFSILLPPATYDLPPRLSSGSSLTTTASSLVTGKCSRWSYGVGASGSPYTSFAPFLAVNPARGPSSRVLIDFVTQASSILEGDDTGDVTRLIELKPQDCDMAIDRHLASMQGLFVHVTCCDGHNVESVSSKALYIHRFLPGLSPLCRGLLTTFFHLRRGCNTI